LLDRDAPANDEQKDGKRTAAAEAVFAAAEN
jgi:hypothetical protein